MAHSHLTIEEIGARSVLMPQNGVPVTGYTLNPYVGCGMGCSYCYVMKYPHVQDNPRPWGTWVQPKMNAPFLLGKARAKMWGRGIFIGSATDPYQYIERQYRLTRRCLKVILESNPKSVVIHTRSPVILDDLELIREFGNRLRVGFSVPTDDDRVRRKLEPHAPRIEVRLKTMCRLRDAGITVLGSLTPLLYCKPRRFVQLLKGAVDGVYMGGMRYLDKTAIHQMKQAKIYFGSTAYEELQDEMRQCLINEGLLKDYDGD